MLALPEALTRILVRLRYRCWSLPPAPKKRPVLDAAVTEMPILGPGGAEWGTDLGDELSLYKETGENPL